MCIARESSDRDRRGAKDRSGRHRDAEQPRGKIIVNRRNAIHSTPSSLRILTE